MKIEVLDNLILKIAQEENRPLLSRELVTLTNKKIDEENLSINKKDVTEAVLRLLSLGELARDLNWHCVVGEQYRPVKDQDKILALKGKGFIFNENQTEAVILSNSIFITCSYPFNVFETNKYERRIHYARHITAQAAIQNAWESLMGLLFK